MKSGRGTHQGRSHHGVAHVTSRNSVYHKTTISFKLYFLKSLAARGSGPPATGPNGRWKAENPRKRRGLSAATTRLSVSTTRLSAATTHLSAGTTRLGGATTSLNRPKRPLFGPNGPILAPKTVLPNSERPLWAGHPPLSPPQVPPSSQYLTPQRPDQTWKSGDRVRFPPLGGWKRSFHLWMARKGARKTLDLAW